MKNLTIMSLLIMLFVVFSGVAVPGNNLVNGASAVFKLPVYEKVVLKNGLTVYLMEQHEVPLITLSVVFPAGSIKDGNQYGLASFTADTLLLGTKSYTQAQIAEKFDFFGTNYNISAFKESASFNITLAKTDLEALMPIVTEIVMAPSFDEKEFDKKKKQTLLQLEMAKEQPAAVLGSYFNKFLFGDHVYGTPTSGIPSFVANFTIDDLKNFYKKNYFPGESAIAVVGDFETGKMKEQIDTWFGSWTVENAAASQPVPVPALNFEKSRVLLVNKEDATETRFSIGAPGIARSNPDYLPIQVINTILGGRFTSWLNDELRVNAGLTYGVNSRFHTYKQTGLFSINSFTATASTVRALDLALEVLGRLHKTGVDAKTLDSAKNYIKGQFPPDFETPDQLAQLLTDMFVYGFDESYINNFQTNVDLMTVEKAKVIIAKYFPQDKLQFVLIGKAADIREAVKKYGDVTEKEIKTEGF